MAGQWFSVIWILSLALWTPAGKTMVIFVNYWQRIISRNHGLRTPNQAFFHWNSELLVLGILGIFGQTISTHFGILSPLYSIIQPLFLQKTKPLQGHPGQSVIKWTNIGTSSDKFEKKIWLSACSQDYSIWLMTLGVG